MKNTTIYNRCKKDKNNSYTIISNNIVKNKFLSYLEKGIMLILLSNDDSWAINKKQVFKESNVGETNFNKAWANLVKYNYIEMRRIKGGVEWTINECPEEFESKKETEQVLSDSKEIIEEDDIITPKEDKTTLNDDLNDLKEQSIKYKIEKSFIIDHVYPKTKVVEDINDIIKCVGIKNKSEILMLEQVFKINYDSKSDTILIMDKNNWKN